MTQIAYYNDGNKQIVIRPTAEALETLTFDQIIEMSVPTGTQYTVCDEADLPVVPVVITTDDITRERDRRIEAGFDVTLTGFTGTVALQGRQQDMTNLIGLGMAAQIRIAMGLANSPMVFRDRLNITHTLTAAQMLELWSKGSAWVSAQYQNAWNLKELIEIGMDVSDYTDDQYWP